MATSLVSKINTSVALVKGWVNSFLAFMGQLYFGFYTVAALKRSYLPYALVLTVHLTVVASAYVYEIPAETIATMGIR
jgi:hypothetical protein